ncbi:MAG: methyltransferase domain-containing protein [Chloroflexota bacterium]|nr:methyltransferase domain-containing protein [Chloroflexota bacterium]
MVEPSPLQQRVAQHYSQPPGGDLLAAVLGALQAAGTDVSGKLRYEDMGGIDHFHGGALAATRALAELGELRPGELVLDMGGGFGGPARTLAAEYGCQVTVLDPTEAFIRAGQALTERLGLQDAVQFFPGSGLDMPFADEHFDVVWTQNASMNIPDKARLVAEQRRVLRPGGRLVFQEICAGPGGDLVCPVPWARDPAISFLVPPEQVRTLLRETGFEERVWLPLAPGERTPAASATEPVRSAAAVVHGPDAVAMEAASRRNQAEQRVIYLRGVFVRQASLTTHI